MNKMLIFCVWAVLFAGLNEAFCQNNKPRVIVLTDGEIDDHSSMVRFLMYTNDIKLEAIIETNSVYQRKGHSNEDWLEKQLDAYEQVYSNLIKHDSNYPSAAEIRSKCFVGDEDPNHLIVDWRSENRGPGSEVKIMPDDWPDTPGSDKIVEILLQDNSSPVYISVWGGGNTAARAFYKLKMQYPDKYDQAVSKVVMYNIWYQDGAGNYIEKFHPKVTMLLSRFFHGSWDYGSQSFTHAFVEKDVKNNHGALGALYPQDYVSEGDSPAFLYTLMNGLRSYEDPTYGGWGGIFYKVDGFENVYEDISEGSYSMWIEDANRDFQSRLDWCVAERYKDANHKPEIKIEGKLDRNVKSGEIVTINAEETVDPDGNQILFRWWQYAQAGTYKGMIKLDNPYSKKISFIAPSVEKPETIHLILEVQDYGNPGLTSYKRVIITVSR